MNYREILGKGVLTWDAKERRTDRYGAIWLTPEGQTSFSNDITPSLVISTSGLEGRKGKLHVLITATRESTHIGDLFHGVFPETPNVGEIITLGEGRLFYEPCAQGGHCVGLKPDDNRPTFWLDIKKLYRCHEQSVQLMFEETQ